MNNQNRIFDVIEFYRYLDILESSIGIKYNLDESNVNQLLPSKGVYFFFEPGEFRIKSSNGLRVTRIGTHGLKQGSKSTLWSRLRQHRGFIKGDNAGGGNHRGSVFRKHVGSALINRYETYKVYAGSWGRGSSATKEIRDLEYPLELEVNRYIRSMIFIWVEIDDASGPVSLRGYVERNAIALLSNSEYCNVDKPSENWLGGFSDSEFIRQSGLWNVNHVNNIYDEDFLQRFSEIIKADELREDS